MQSISTTLHKNNLEKVWQIWLSNSTSDSRNIANALEQVRSLISHLKTFENIIECEQFIRSLSTEDRIAFIVDDLLGEQIIPQIHDLPQVFAIYVYSTERQPNESYFKQFSKVTIHRTILMIV
jgi:hypothetical protein